MMPMGLLLSDDLHLVKLLEKLDGILDFGNRY